MDTDDILGEEISPITYISTGKLLEIPYEVDMSIAQALRILGVTLSRGEELRVNNEPITDFDTTLNPGDQIMTVGNVAGG